MTFDGIFVPFFKGLSLVFVLKNSDCFFSPRCFVSKEAAKEAVEAAEVAKEVALAEGQEASNWFTRDVGEEIGSAVQDLAESSRGRGRIQILIPEEGELDDDTDLQRSGCGNWDLGEGY